EGLINCINVLQPDVVCIGGGVSNEGDFLIERILDHVARYRFGIENISHPRIVCARLGGEAGLIGAAMLGQQ
ncbi:MAG: ROK family protein, partial [Clostridia bacterium]|nr:ROK family protein [Clostridia bacterium]